MAKYTQANRMLSITTPLGPDALLLEKFQGTEALSELFCFQMELLAEDPVDFKRVLNQRATVTLSLANGSRRLFDGVVSRLSQGRRVSGPMGRVTFTRYKAELVPALWRLTQRVQSRIFQHQSVPAILSKVLRDDWMLDVVLQLTDTYSSHNFCVQYRESDFSFVSRLMEEEGICYYFKHTPSGHQLVLTDTPSGHPDLPDLAVVRFQEEAVNAHDGPGIQDWEKTQEVRPSRHVLRDYCFELPHSNLEAHGNVEEQVAVGQAQHALRFASSAGSAEALEVYDYPGAFAHRFDGVASGGGDNSKELEKLFQENGRLARLRAEQEAVQSLCVRGAGDAGHFTPGMRFRLERHFDADGQYLLTSVEHRASLEGVYTGSPDAAPAYENTFRCAPALMPFRPPPVTPRPRVEGTQTALVVGPPGEEIFCDKYGRVKVQFHWDRHGQRNADSSCWVRVSQSWAGRGFGAIQVPRVGQEVVVAFLEGDPDWPIIVGCVYNGEQMPPYELPARAAVSGIRTHSTSGGHANYNEIRFDDTPEEEDLHVHAERDLSIHVERNVEEHVEGDVESVVDHNATDEVKGSRKVVTGTEPPGASAEEHPLHAGDVQEVVCGTHVVEVYGDFSRHVNGQVARHAGGNESHHVDHNLTLHVGGNLEEHIDGSVKRHAKGVTYNIHDRPHLEMVLGLEHTAVVGLKNEMLFGGVLEFTLAAPIPKIDLLVGMSFEWVLAKEWAYHGKHKVELCTLKKDFLGLEGYVFSSAEAIFLRSAEGVKLLGQEVKLTGMEVKMIGGEVSILTPDFSIKCPGASIEVYPGVIKLTAGGKTAMLNMAGWSVI